MGTIKAKYRNTSGTNKSGRGAPLIPYYAVVPLLSCFIVNCIIYFGVARLTYGWKHYDLTLQFDRSVPLIPSFVLVYLGCYLFWAANYILIGKQGKEYCIRFATADMLSRLVCGCFFVFMPTTNVRPVLIGNDIWTRILGMIYQIDGAVNLFPSIHCLVSWFCFIGIRGRKNVPKLYRIFSCVMAILVFISTQVIKQHYIVDVIGAVILAEITYYIGFHTNLYKGPEKLFCKITRILFGEKGITC